jgi:hypothetical protein
MEVSQRLAETTAATGFARGRLPLNLRSRGPASRARPSHSQPRSQANHKAKGVASRKALDRAAPPAYHPQYLSQYRFLHAPCGPVSPAMPDPERLLPTLDAGREPVQRKVARPEKGGANRFSFGSPETPALSISAVLLVLVGGVRVLLMAARIGGRRLVVPPAPGGRASAGGYFFTRLNSLVPRSPSTTSSFSLSVLTL